MFHKLISFDEKALSMERGDVTEKIHHLAEEEFEKYHHAETMEDRRYHYCRFDFFMQAYEKEVAKWRRK